MAVATDRLLKRFQRLRNKSTHILMDASVTHEFTPVLASSSFQKLCKKAMSVCIIDPLWRIVRLSAPELIKFLHEEEEEGYASLNVYWLKSLPTILYELQSVVNSLGDSRNQTVSDRYIFHEVNQDEEVKRMLETIKGMLSDYFPLLDIDEQTTASSSVEEMKTVIDVMLILCSEFRESDEEFVVFDAQSRRLLERGFTQKQLELLSIAGRLPLKRNVDEEETVVGFEDDTIKLLDRLTGYSKKLEVIPIVGMAGLGKTTFAKRVYADPFIAYFFDIRAWCCVSQEYVKRDLLLSILSSIVQLTNRIHSLSDEQLGEQIYRGLKGLKYLVVFDDIWDNKAMKDLILYFPDDRNGSRILLTTRNIGMNLDATTTPHKLRLRTQRESWRILQTMVFKNGKCPWRLDDIGKQICRKCWGLPLAISIIAGIVKSRWSRASWKEVAESLSNYIVSDPNQYMDTLALSYNHLPPHLRPCFLYLGAFPGDCEIPVKKLVLSWVAQGFIDQSGNNNDNNKTLEDVAESYLMELLARSLVMVSKKGADGEIKACHVHDLLRSLCLWKAKEEGFLPIIYRYTRVSSPLSPIAAAKTQTNPSQERVNFVLCCPIELGESFQVGKPVDYDTYKFLKILDIESTYISSFPKETLKLLNLRYLAIQAEDGNPPESISNLVNLQILVVSSRKNIFIPKSTWDMESLRHLYVKSRESLIENVSSNKSLENLQTISGVCPTPSCISILSRTQNLRKLCFYGPLVSNLGVLEFPNVQFLNHLTILKLTNTKIFHAPVKSCNPLMFPERLTRLTLSNTALNWNEIQTIGLLPNLEVLKLNVDACIGEKWETTQTTDTKGFVKLKVLKLQDLDIAKWEASSLHFPMLQRLVVRRCSRLQEIPCGVGEILTLELIEVSWCGESAAKSARMIQKEQEKNGNDFLKVVTAVHRDLQGKRKRSSYD